MGRPSRAEWKDYIAWAPDANAALLALGKAVDGAGFDKSLVELVKLRCSQMNGCAHCVQWHTEAGRKAVPRLGTAHGPPARVRVHGWGGAQLAAMRETIQRPLVSRRNNLDRQLVKPNKPAHYLLT